MHFPRFWKKAHDRNVTAWGWSDASPEDAIASATERVKRIRDWLASGEGRRDAEETYYPGRPMREEVLREFQDDQGALVAAVSRNSTGCLVLNATHLLFVDVDEPYVKPAGILAKLFGGKKGGPAEPFEEKIRLLAEEWLRARPDWGWRIYRTKAGVRMLATHATVSHDAPDVASAFSAFGADPLYRNLCEKQQCFRARLTPKAWRCNIRNAPARWPWKDAREESAYQEWEQGYLNAAKDFATCRLVGHYGVQEIHPALLELVGFHDQATRIDTTLPLA